ncbi:hypothetical protein C8R44DRAFT_889807 [Mycena epipterygia]|nr:hypothetical protein C8R44DRAFT_889807 [Mycena epipterygia]
MLMHNTETAKLMEESIASTSSGNPSSPSSNPFIATAPEQLNARHSLGLRSIDSEFKSIPSDAPSYPVDASTPRKNDDDRPVVLWNLSPRSPHTPVRERAAPQEPPLLSRARLATGFEPVTPSPLPRTERLPFPQIDPASLERWFHTGVYEDAHEDGGVAGQGE